MSVFNSDSIWIDTTWDLFSLNTNPLIKHSYDRHNSKCKTFANKCTNHTHKQSHGERAKACEKLVRKYIMTCDAATRALSKTPFATDCDCNLDFRIWPSNELLMTISRKFSRVPDKIHRHAHPSVFLGRLFTLPAKPPRHGWFSLDLLFLYIC